MGIQALGDLGADVISVEGSDGAWQRHWAGGNVFARRPERAAPVRQPQQAQRGHRSQVGQGPRACAAAGRLRRRGGGELPSRRDGEAGSRLRSAGGAQALPDLCLGVRLWTRWPVRGEAGAGPSGASAVRHDGHHRPGLDRTASGRRLRHRPSRRGAVRHGDHRRHRAPAAHGTRLPRRRQPDAVGARPAGGVAGRLGQCRRQAAGAAGLPQRGGLVLRRALRRLRHQRRPPRHFALATLGPGRGCRRAAVGRLHRQGYLEQAG